MPAAQDYQVRQNRRFMTKTFIKVTGNLVTDHVAFWLEEQKHFAAGLAPLSDTLQNTSVGRIRWRTFFLLMFRIWSLTPLSVAAEVQTYEDYRSISKWV